MEPRYLRVKNWDKPLSWSELRLEILRRDGYTCRYCGKRPKQLQTERHRFTNRRAATLHIDHIVPRSKGGSDAPFNLVTACVSCNLTKYNHVWEPPPPPNEVEPWDWYEDHIADETHAWDSLAEAAGL